MDVILVKALINHFSLRTKDSILNALNLVNVSDARVTFRDEDSGGEEVIWTQLTKSTLVISDP